MWHDARQALIAGIVLGWLALGPARAVTPQIKDDAAFFKPATLNKANNEILRMNRDYHKDLVIETMKAAPKDKAELVKDSASRDRAFAEWGGERARALGVDGIYVLICAEPRHLRIGVG